MPSQPLPILPEPRKDFVAEPTDRVHPGTSHKDKVYPALARGSGTWTCQADVTLKAELQGDPPPTHWSACKRELSVDV